MYFYKMVEKINSVIKAFELGYRVDKDGNVSGIRKKNIKLNINNSGYKYFTIRLSSIKTRTVTVHRLQAYQKYKNDMFVDGIVVRHKNGDALDNSFNNILIGTQSDNMMDKPEEQRILEASNPTHNHLEIIKDKIKGLTHKQLMEKYSISSKSTISFIVNKSLTSKNISLY